MAMSDDPSPDPDGLSSYERHAARLERCLLPHLTPDFLKYLAVALRTFGAVIQHGDATTFVLWCYAVAGKTCPDLTPCKQPGRRKKPS
jgi:hypothetical protein